MAGIARQNREWHLFWHGIGRADSATCHGWPQDLAVLRVSTSCMVVADTKPMYLAGRTKQVYPRPLVCLLHHLQDTCTMLGRAPGVACTQGYDIGN